jgi:hypothetical protein
LEGEVQGRGGGPSGTHQNLELYLTVMAKDGEESGQPGGQNREEEGKGKERRAWGSYRRGLDGHLHARNQRGRYSSDRFRNRERERRLRGGRR